MNKVVILAAGKGSRMNSNIPKVLFPINNVPMIEYLINSVLSSGVDDSPVIVVSPENKEAITSSLAKYKLNFVVQNEQLGTGHAVSCARKFIFNNFQNILIFYGDHPFISPQSIKKLIKNHDQEVSMMITEVEDFSDWRKNFYYWGRIIKNGKMIEKIVEFKDASDEEKNIKEVNPALFCFNREWLFNNIDKLKNNNNQKEYYLTDLIKMASEQGINISFSSINPQEAIGVNSPEELEIARKLAKKIK